MPKWLHAAIGIVVIAGALTAIVVLNDGGTGDKGSRSGDDPPKTNYSDDPGAKGLKIPSTN